MILVDSAVWIDWINQRPTPQTRALDRVALDEIILLGDLVLCEVLMGLRDDSTARRVEPLLRRFRIVPVSSDDVAREAAMHHRRLRALGVTIRSTIDLLIGTFCITHGHELLHRDRGFDAMERHLGLSVVRT